MTSSSSSTARAGNVVTLSRSRFDCAVCGERGGWLVEDTPACREHVMDELEQRYAANPHPFTPPLVVPMRGSRPRKDVT